MALSFAAFLALVAASSVACLSLFSDSVVSFELSLVDNSFSIKNPNATTNAPIPVDTMAALNALVAAVAPVVANVYTFFAMDKNPSLAAACPVTTLANCCTPLAIAVTAVVLLIISCRSLFSSPNNAAAPCAISNPAVSPCTAPTAASNLNVSDAKTLTLSLVSPIWSSSLAALNSNCSNSAVFSLPCCSNSANSCFNARNCPVKDFCLPSASSVVAANRSISRLTSTSDDLTCDCAAAFSLYALDSLLPVANNDNCSSSNFLSWAVSSLDSLFRLSNAFLTCVDVNAAVIALPVFLN